MKALILAAGRGSRMGSLTEAVPKCLLPLAGRTLLDWQCLALRQGGVTEIGVVRGYRGDLLEGRGLTLFDNPRWADTNMVSSLECAAVWLEQEPVLISYSDIFYPASAVRSLCGLPGAEIALTYDPGWRWLWSQRFANPLEDAESFQTDDSGALTDIGRRVDSYQEIRGQYMGLIRMTPAGWAAVTEYRRTLPPAMQDKMHMTGTLSALLARGVRVQTVPLAEEKCWGEADNEQDLAVYERLLAAGDLTLPG